MVEAAGEVKTAGETLASPQGADTAYIWGK